MSRETDLAWAAGFFEGEGSFSVTRTGPYEYARADIGQIVREPLDRFREIVGVGNVTGPVQPKNPRWNPIWTWRCQSHKDSAAVISMLWPYLSEWKRLKVKRVMDIVFGEPKDLSS